MRKVPLSSPDIIEKDIEAVVDVMKTRFLSIGPRWWSLRRKWVVLPGQNMRWR